ncbi:HAD-IA family hydrolase [Actinokineospora sp. PR83]|uniref:HAD family hydrolase n=1 Tax=Actinokineospora sp. PR83 TaxID=2884908 RepID=UPI001F216283|nr:HAD-IA family hydrolase [Actinokineospora sp. PR83]MCG8917193.1 HAD-IA family hydrolase [Actinokineospora sp. PR83]
MRRLAVWSDFRGVYTPPLAEGVRRFCAGTAHTPAQVVECLRAIAARHGCPDGMAVLDSGVLDERSWTREIERELVERFDVTADLSGFAARWWSDQRVDRAWVAALRRWRGAGVFVGLLSNLPVEWKGYLATFPGVADTFDAVLLSCDVGTRKPDAEMFRLAAARSGLDPRSTVLVDDLVENVAGARRAGWLGVVSGGESTRAAIALVDRMVSGEAAISEGVSR